MLRHWHDGRIILSHLCWHDLLIVHISSGFYWWNISKSRVIAHFWFPTLALVPAAFSNYWFPCSWHTGTSSEEQAYAWPITAVPRTCSQCCHKSLPMNNAESSLFSFFRGNAWSPWLLSNRWLCDGRMTTWQWLSGARRWLAEQICAPRVIRSLGPRWFPRRHLHAGGCYLHEAAASSIPRPWETHHKMLMEGKYTGLHSTVLSRLESCMFENHKRQPRRMLSVILNTYGASLRKIQHK